MLTQTPEHLVETLRAQGFHHGAPEHLKLWVQQCDRQAAAESPCPCCGRRSLEYHPLHRDATYIALAHCSHCGHELVF